MNRRDFFKTTGSAIIGAAAISADLFAANNTTPIVSNHAIDWINNNIKIKSYTGIIQKLTLNPIQEEYIKKLQNPDTTMLKLSVDRQVGYTTATAAYIVYKMIHETNYNTLIVSAINDQSNYIRDMITYMYLNIPISENQNINAYFSRTNAEFVHNDSKYNRNTILYSTPNNCSVTCRSYSLQLAVLQEYEYYNIDIPISEWMFGIRCSLSTRGVCAAYSYPKV